MRTAYIDLQVANDQVTLADSNRKLATQTLQQSQDRFAVGVADSVEVVSFRAVSCRRRTTTTLTACSLNTSLKSRLPTPWEKRKKDLPELFEVESAMIVETEKTNQPGLEDTEGATPQTGTRRRPNRRVAGAILIVVVAIAAAWYFYGRGL